MLDSTVGGAVGADKGQFATGGLAPPFARYTADMPSWLLLLALPVALGLPCLMLLLSAEAEKRILSPQSLILSAARARRSGPELTEQLVAREFERLLKDTQRR